MDGPVMEDSRVGLFPAPELDFKEAYPFSDVKLVSASGVELYCSRYTLATRSPVCKLMLLAGMRESQPLASSDVMTIPFPAMRTEALEVLLEFCTSGCFSQKQVRETPVDVIHAARYFQLTDHMDELISSVVETLSLASVGSEFELVGTLAEMLSFALECLPTDLDGSFFELLVKKIFSRSIFYLPFAKLSSQALEFLLSKTSTSTLQCNSEPWVSKFAFYSSEYDIYRYVLLWSTRQLPEDVQQLLKPVLGSMPEDKDFDIDNYEPGTAEALQSLATVALRFLQLIDYRVIHPGKVARHIKPLGIVPADLLREGFWHHHPKAPELGPTILYRGRYILQWCPSTRHESGCGFKCFIDDYTNGRDLYCTAKTTGFARAYSCLRGSGEHSWLITVSDCSHPGGIGIGFCFDTAVNNYSHTWLRYGSPGWFLDGTGRFWENGRPAPAPLPGGLNGRHVISRSGPSRPGWSGPSPWGDGPGPVITGDPSWEDAVPVISGESGSGDRIPRGDPITFGAHRTKVQVSVNLDTGICRFTVGKAGGKVASVEIRVTELANRSIGTVIYPAVGFYNSSGQVSLSPCPM